MSDIVLKNYYKELPKEYVKEEETYANYNKLKIKLNTRLLLVGTSGSGKTTVALNLIELMGCFTKYYIFVKDLEEPIYKYLIDKLKIVEEKTGKKIVIFSDDMKDLPEVNDYAKNETNLIIFDDMISEKETKLSKVSELFMRGRKRNCTVFFISQSFFKTPKLIRANTDYIILKKVPSKTSTNRILAEFNSLNVSKEAFYKMYRDSTIGLTDFFLIDCKTNDNNLTFRHNFTSINMSKYE